MSGPILIHMPSPPPGWATEVIGGIPVWQLSEEKLYSLLSYKQEVFRTIGSAELWYRRNTESEFWPLDKRTPSRTSGVMAAPLFTEHTEALPSFSIREAIQLVEDNPLEWLIEGFWTADGFGMIFGGEKTLKSYLATLVMLSTTSGLPLFGHFAVPKPQRVAMLTGEGGIRLVTLRLLHLAKLYGMSKDDVADLPINLTDEIASTQSDAFQDTVKTELERGAKLVIVDPFYCFAGAIESSGNLYVMAEALNAMSQLTNEAGAALIVVNHTRKSAGGIPSLTDITQAGSREWCNNWAGVWHRDDADLGNQRFKLGLSIGSREGYGSMANLNLDLGPFDHQEVRHSGEPSLELSPYIHRGDVTPEGLKTMALEYLQEHADSRYTLSSLSDSIGGTSGSGPRTQRLTAIKELIADKEIAVRRERHEGDRQLKDYLYVVEQGSET